MTEADYKNKIEAILFASGRLMSIETLLNLTGASGKQVLINNINRLKTEYEERNSPLMIVEEKDGWKLTVREAYLPLVRKIISETELPKTILETLAIIAWKAPVLQSEVIDIRHNKAYDHISELEELGFLRKEQSGRSYMLHLTEKFYEYFDVEGSKDIRDVFNKVVGSPDQRKVDDFDGILDDSAPEDKQNISEEQEIEKQLHNHKDIDQEVQQDQDSFELDDESYFSEEDEYKKKNIVSTKKEFAEEDTEQEEVSEKEKSSVDDEYSDEL